MRYVEFRELDTPRLYLRKIDMEDLRDYNRFTGDPEVTRYMNFQTHKNIAESAASIEKWAARYDTGRSYHWGIALKGSNRLVGMIDLLGCNEANGSCSFAYMLSREFWGKGYGTEALQCVIDFGFEQMELQYIEADHMAENAASGAVMRKVGMIYQGAIPGKYEKNGIRRDAHRYVINRRHWLEGK